jgi:hypothetical protein
MSGLAAVERSCPYCGEIIELLIDGSVPRQQYVEDCPVCCQPMVVTATVRDDDQEPDVELRREGD